MVVHNCLVLPKHNRAVFYSEVNHKLKVGQQITLHPERSFWQDQAISVKRFNKIQRHEEHFRGNFWDNVQYGSVVKPFKPKAQYDHLPIHNSSYKILHEFLHFYLLAKTEIFYMLNGFVLAAKRNCFLILKNQFSPVFTFITEICLLLKRTSIKLHIGLCKLFLNNKSL